MVKGAVPSRLVALDAGLETADIVQIVLLASVVLGTNKEVTMLATEFIRAGCALSCQQRTLPSPHPFPNISRKEHSRRHCHVVKGVRLETKLAAAARPRLEHHQRS